MTDTFGYRPVSLPSYVARYQDYLVGRFPDYQPTRWDNKDEVNIESLWDDIRAVSDEETRGLVELWRRIEVLLDSVRTRLADHAHALERHWNSPAGEEFLRRVGAALYSIDEWREVAATNKSVLDGIASAIADAQRRMRDVWFDYIAKYKVAHRNATDDSFWAPLANIFREDNPESVRDDYTEDAKRIMQPLADHYLDTALALDRGTHYRGPTSHGTNPVMDRTNPDGGSPALPGAPALPHLPNPPMPTPSPAPPGPQFAGVAAPLLATAPTTPTPPTMPPGTAVPPGAAVPPGVTLPPGVAILPSPPGVPGSSAPPRPGQPSSANLQRPSGPTSPAAPAGPRQQLQGSSPRTGVPGLPRRPSLRGSATQPTASAPPSTPGQAPPPGAGARTSPTPPSLTGRRGGTKGPTPAGQTPAAGPGTGGTGTSLAGRRGPGTAPKRLPNPRGITRALAGGMPPVPLPRPAERSGRRIDGRHTPIDGRHAPSDSAERTEVPPAEPPTGGRILGRDR